jgi:hypothetical protein
LGEELNWLASSKINVWFVGDFMEASGINTRKAVYTAGIKAQYAMPGGCNWLIGFV